MNVNSRIRILMVFCLILSALFLTMLICRFCVSSASLARRTTTTTSATALVVHFLNTPVSIRQKSAALSKITHLRNRLPRKFCALSK